MSNNFELVTAGALSCHSCLFADSPPRHTMRRSQVSVEWWPQPPGRVSQGAAARDHPTTLAPHRPEWPVPRVISLIGLIVLVLALGYLFLQVMIGFLIP